MLIFIKLTDKLKADRLDYMRSVVPTNEIYLSNELVELIDKNWIRDQFGQTPCKVDNNYMDPGWLIFEFTNLEEAMLFKLKWA